MPNYGHQGRGPRLVPGMTIAIEPMICQYDCKIKQLSDGWTVKTKDGGLAAHFEHSIAILKDRTEIMTRFWDDPDFDPETFCLEVSNLDSPQAPGNGRSFCSGEPLCNSDKFW